jgi:predicted dehydrogenase
VKYRLAAIGVRHGHCWSIIKGLLATGKAELVAIAEEHPLMRKRATEKYPDVPLYRNREECLNTVKPDGIILTTRNFEKQRVVVDCLERGIGVIADKPLFTEKAWLVKVEKMWRAQRKKTPLSVAFLNRTNPCQFTLKQMVARGELGEIVHIYKCRPHRLGPQGRMPWEVSRRQNGGPLIDLGSHDVDFANWLIGSRPVEVTAYAKMSRFKDIKGFYDNGQMMVRYENGAVLMVETDWLTPDKSIYHGDCRTMVTGTKGFAEDYEHLHLLKVTTDRRAERTVPNPKRTCNLYENFLAQFTGKPKWLTPEEIFLAHRVLLAADESSRRGGVKVRIKA